MVINDKYKYKRISKIEEVGTTLSGRLFRYSFSNKETKMYAEHEIVEYYTQHGDFVKGPAKFLKLGDMFLIKD